MQRSSGMCADSASAAVRNTRPVTFLRERQRIPVAISAADGAHCGIKRGHGFTDSRRSRYHKPCPRLYRTVCIVYEIALTGTYVAKRKRRVCKIREIFRVRGDDLGERKRSRKERFKCAREKIRIGIGGKMLFLPLR